MSQIFFSFHATQYRWWLRPWRVPGKSFKGPWSVIEDRRILSRPATDTVSISTIPENVPYRESLHRTWDKQPSLHSHYWEIPNTRQAEGRHQPGVPSIFNQSQLVSAPSLNTSNKISCYTQERTDNRIYPRHRRSNPWSVPKTKFNKNNASAACFFLSILLSSPRIKVSVFCHFLSFLRIFLLSHFHIYPETWILQGSCRLRNLLRDICKPRQETFECLAKTKLWYRLFLKMWRIQDKTKKSEGTLLENFKHLSILQFLKS